MNHFKNSQALGSFGEFCYSKFTKAKGIEIEKVGILEYDFNVCNSLKVDVKTTQSKKIKYSGKRVREDISYDIISVINDKVTIYPDSSSPLLKFSGCVIGDLSSLYDEWLLSKSNKNILIKTQNIHKQKRNLIDNCIKSYFPDKKIRVVFRGSVSKTRWSSSPDNLPGSPSNVKNYDVTIFVQMITGSEFEEINRIYLFNHDDFNNIKMKEPDRRQSNKGVLKVIDYEWYELNFPTFVFNNLEELQKSVATN